MSLQHLPISCTSDSDGSHMIMVPLNVLEFLLNSLIPVISFYRDISTSLDYASWSIYHAVVDSLLQGGETPLIWASFYGHKKVAVLLLEQSANVDAQDEVIVMLLSNLYWFISMFIIWRILSMFVKKFVVSICITWSPLSKHDHVITVYSCGMVVKMYWYLRMSYTLLKMVCYCSTTVCYYWDMSVK